MIAVSGESGQQVQRFESHKPLTVRRQYGLPRYIFISLVCCVSWSCSRFAHNYLHKGNFFLARSNEFFVRVESREFSELEHGRAG